MIPFKSNVISIFVIVFCLFVTLCVFVTCQANASQAPDYFLGAEEVNWYQALINCRGTGMELVSIHDDQEKTGFDEFLERNSYKKDTFWLGATNQGNGEFYWATTGIKMDFQQWQVGQPDDFEGLEHCVAWTPDKGQNLAGWADLPCSYTYKYVCQNFQSCPSRE